MNRIGHGAAIVESQAGCPCAGRIFRVSVTDRAGSEVRL